jgi:hypothetical protein
MYTKFWIENLRGKGHMEDLGQDVDWMLQNEFFFSFLANLQSILQIEQ